MSASGSHPNDNPLLQTLEVTSEHDNEAIMLASVVGGSSQHSASSSKGKSRSWSSRYLRSILRRPDDDVLQIKNSNMSTVFLLLNLMIGSGILVQAYVFRETGIALTFLEYVIIGTMIFAGVNLTIRAAEKYSNFDYAMLAQEVLPPRGGFYVDLCISLSNAGALLSYILIVGSLLQNIVLTFTDCSAWYCNIGFLTFMPVYALSLPLCLIRAFGHLAGIAYLSIAVIGACVFLVLVGGPIRNTTGKVDHYGSLKYGSFEGCIATIGDIVFALGFIPGIFPAYAALETKTVKNFTRITFETTVIGVLMCSITGFAGYMCFGNEVKTNILDNFYGTVGAFFKVALIIHLILYIPGDFVIMRSSFLAFFDVKVESQSNFSFISCTVAMITFVTIISVVLQLYVGGESLGIVIDVTGGLTGSALYFVLPGLIGRHSLCEDTFLRRASNTLLVFGVVIMIMVIVSIAIDSE